MKVTLITGASNGLGKEFAFLYAKDNNHLLLIDIDEKNLLKVKHEINKLNPIIEVYVLCVDLSLLEDMKKVKKYVEDNNLFVNNLVNCAGFGDCKDFLDMDIEKQIKMTEVDCNAVLYFTKIFLDEMIKHDEGHIINVSSIAAFYPGPFMCTYHACKSFVLMLGEAVAHEIRNTKVKLLTLCPGPFKSEFVSKAHNYHTFNKLKPIEASQVAKIGYQKSRKGKSLAVIGFKNKLMIFASRFAPRKFVTKTSAKMLKKEH